MQYMLLIYDDEKTTDTMTDAQRQEFMGAYYAYTNELKEAGKFVAGDALQPAATATSVRVRSGETVTTDGPFAETKELLGGYYLIEADDLDDAIKWAAKIPSAALGTVEVRPVIVFDR